MQLSLNPRCKHIHDLGFLQATLLMGKLIWFDATTSYGHQCRCICMHTSDEQILIMLLSFKQEYNSLKLCDALR